MSAPKISNAEWRAARRAENRCECDTCWAAYLRGGPSSVASLGESEPTLKSVAPGASATSTKSEASAEGNDAAPGATELSAASLGESEQ